MSDVEHCENYRRDYCNSYRLGRASAVSIYRWFLLLIHGWKNPMKGISKFYCGKSKSFTILSDAATCSSMKDIVKPENAYSRKRKNLMAYKNLWDRNTNNIRNNSGGISERPNNSRSMLALAAISNSGESSNCETSNSTSSPPGCSLPPLPPYARRTIYSELSSSPPTDKFSSWRSFSLSDLQGAAADASSPGIPGLWINNRGK